MANLNPLPSANPLAKKFTLSTLDVNGNAILESGYIVSPPGGIGISPVPVNAPQSPYSKFLIYLDNTNTYALKIWIPNPTSGVRDVYMTYSKRANSYDDGFRDLISTNDSDLNNFRAALRSWIIGNIIPLPTATYTKNIGFTFRGTDTNQIQNSGSFNFSLQAIPSQTGQIGLN